MNTCYALRPGMPNRLPAEDTWKMCSEPGAGTAQRLRMNASHTFTTS